MKLTSLAFSLSAPAALASAEGRELRAHDMCSGEHRVKGSDAEERAHERVRTGRRDAANCVGREGASSAGSRW